MPKNIVKSLVVDHVLAECISKACGVRGISASALLRQAVEFYLAHATEIVSFALAYERIMGVPAGYLASNLCDRQLKILCPNMDVLSLTDRQRTSFCIQPKGSFWPKKHPLIED